MNFLKSAIILSLTTIATTSAFTINSNAYGLRLSTTKLKSFYADSSDYKNSDSDYSSDDDSNNEYGVPIGGGAEDEEVESLTSEESPVPMSKNAGNRFVALVFDKALSQNEDADVLDLHEDRISLTEDHVMFCRKANLYNETFNSESMADVLWSNQL